MSDKLIVKQHEFEQAKDNDILWRYMSFKNFVWLLEKKQLYQSSVSRFDDPFEGSLPKLTHKSFNESFKKWYPKHELNRFSQKRKLLKDTTYASCWSLRETESEAFWKIYCKKNDSVVIKTTYGKLKKFASSKFDIIGKVKYLDYNTENLELFSPLTPFMHKRKAFDFESEVRIATLYNVYEDKDISLFPYYCVINIPIEKLIDKIIVHPTADKDYIDFVKRSVEDYSSYLATLVQQSEMIETPLF